MSSHKCVRCGKDPGTWYKLEWLKHLDEYGDGDVLCDKCDSELSRIGWEKERGPLNHAKGLVNDILRFPPEDDDMKDSKKVAMVERYAVEVRIDECFNQANCFDAVALDREKKPGKQAEVLTFRMAAVALRGRAEALQKELEEKCQDKDSE